MNDESTTTVERVHANGDARSSGRPVLRPRVDVRETTDAWVFLAEMPGVGQDEVEVTLEKNVLTMRGTPREEAHEGRALRREYESGVYERSFTLSDEVAADGVEATMKNGLLTLRLPKARPTRRRIEVRGA